MPYLGRPVTNAGQFEIIDDISSSFNGSNTSFTLQVGGTDIQPDSANVTIVLDGVVQIPTTAYSITGSTLNFSEAPANGTGFHGVLAGQSQFIESGFITNTHISDSANISGSKINTDFSAQTVQAKIFSGMISGSAQIATDISGSLGSNAAIIRTLDRTTISGSIPQALATNSSPTFAAGTITGDLSVGGTLTAQEVHTEFESASILFTSGSTQFGNSIDDIHRMTGSLLMTGSMVVGKGKGISPLGEFDVSVNTAGSRRFTVSFEDSLVSLSAKNGSNNGEVLKLMGDDLVIHTGTNTSGTEKMRIDTTGNVGVGTNNPDGKVHIHSATAGSVTAGGSADELVVENNGDAGISVLSPDGNSSRIQFGSPSDNDIGHIGGFYNSGNEYLFFSVDGSARMVIGGATNAGNVGIGTNNPGNPLHLYSDTYPQLSIDGTDNSGNIGFVLSGSGGRGGMRWNGSNNDVEILREGGAVEISLLDGGGTTFAGDVELTGTSGQHLKFADDGGSSWSGNHAKIQHHNSYMYLQGGSNGIILRTNSGTNILTMDSSGNTTFAGDFTVTADPGKLGVGAAVNSNVGSSMDVIQVGFTSQWYAEKTDSADRNVYIGNNFYHNGSYHRAIYEDQVCGIQFRAGDIKFRTTGSVPVTTNLEAGGGRARMVVHDDGRVSVGYDQTGEHDLEHDSALVVSSSGASGPLTRNAITAVGFCGAGSFNFGQSTVTFDNIKGDGPCFTLRNLGSSHTDRGPFQVYNGSTRILETRNDGLISGNFNDTSDRDFKQNINSITSSLKEVNDLRPVTFVWKQDEENGQNRGHGQTNIGFIAQEVSESIPRLVSGVSGSSSGLGINTIGVTAVLTKAIQELTQAHKDLRAMITGSSDLGQLKALVSGSSFV